MIFFPKTKLFNEKSCIGLHLASVFNARFNISWNTIYASALNLL